MKNIYLLLLFLPYCSFSQEIDDRCITLLKANDLIQQEHYKPRAVDDSLAVFVFDAFIDAMDNNRILFSSDEYNSLLEYRILIDDYIRVADCSFMDRFIEVYSDAIRRKKKIIENLQGRWFDYNSYDSVQFSKSRFPFDLSLKDLTRVWKKRIRFEILEDISKKSRNYDSLANHFKSLEKSSRKKVFETNMCRINSELTGSPSIAEKLWREFLNIYCSYFDPHTNYLSSETKSSFISSLSTSNLSLGITVGVNDNEEIVIEDIIPGGPAALSKKIDKDDVIISVVNQAGEEHHVSCESLDLVGAFLFSDLNKTLDLTLRKKNGVLLRVNIEKAIMEANINSVCALIAEKDGVRAGYLSIPNFYSSFEPGSTAGCADDVAFALSKLCSQNIDGLIIDLQGNGGGSMDEAIRLAGMFVEGGPLSVLLDRRGKQTVLRDINKGIIYDGPLVVFIDGSSASASEFFAAAMQDYGRSVIVGAPSLGKASMQTIVGLDGEEGDDFVKLTVQKFYRVTGSSAQNVGVVPDVKFPVLFDDITHRESAHPTALDYNTITAGLVFSRFREPNLGKAISRSRERVKVSPIMNTLLNLNKEINSVYEQPAKTVRLTFRDVFINHHATDLLWDKVRNTADRKFYAHVTETPDQIEKIRNNPFEADISSFRLEGARSNPYLDEMIAIIGDLRSR